MLNKRIILGGLIAGAFLLPAVASAGVVTGPCVTCHTMHDSQNGVEMDSSAGTGLQFDMLLRQGGCVGCHATTAANTAAGLAASGIPAPQVNDAANPLAGGYFNAVDEQTHNTADLNAVSGLDNTMTGAGATQAPGGAFALNNAGVPALLCTSCHTAGAGHHTASGSYRMLGAAVVTIIAAPTNYGVDFGSANGVGERQTAQYQATSMNSFCANCHGGFHGGANQNGTIPGSTWARHPTDISMSGAGPSIKAYSAATDIDMVPVGSDGTNTDVVMCISCHVPHGGPYNDLLAFSYATQLAGDSTAVAGCETCHGYTAQGNSM